MGWLRKLFSRKPLDKKTAPRTDTEAVKRHDAFKREREPYVPTPEELKAARKEFETDKDFFRSSPIHRLVREDRERLGLTPEQAMVIADNVAIEEIADRET